MDDHGYLVTISYSDKSIVRLYAENMTRVNVPASPIFVDPPWSLAHYNGAYYVGFSSYILMLDSTNMSVLQNITDPLMVEQRAMTFLNGEKADGRYLGGQWPSAVLQSVEFHVV